jgi:hypothetical protein
MRPTTVTTSIPRASRSTLIRRRGRAMPRWPIIGCCRGGSARPATSSCKDLLNRLPCPLVFDHLAHVPQPAGIAHPVFGVVVDLLHKGKAWVKLSGACQDTKVGPPTYADSTAVALAYVKAAPERLVWGSDWPHRQRRTTTSPTTRCCSISSRLGARRGRAQSHPGRQSGEALRLRVMRHPEKRADVKPIELPDEAPQELLVSG